MSMAWMKRLTLMAAVTSLTSGCMMYRLEQLRNTTPSGTPFQNELSRLYMDFAAQEEKEYDWFNSWHFADKGLMLAYGKDIPPEDPANWNVPAELLPELASARARVMDVLNSEIIRVSPSRAADAQFFFDCWVEQQEENWQEEDIAYCRDNLMKTLDDIGPARREPLAAKPEPAVEKPVAKAVKKEKKAPVAKPVEISKDTIPESTSYAVFFETGKAEVSEPGMNVINEVIKSVHNAQNYDVVLHSSKDYPGMAAERIQVVKKLLIAGGVKDSAIRVGKSDDAIALGRRRVEIFLNE